MVSETCQRQIDRQPLAAASQPLAGHVTSQWQLLPASWRLNPHSVDEPTTFRWLNDDTWCPRNTSRLHLALRLMLILCDRLSFPPLSKLEGEYPFDILENWLVGCLVWWNWDLFVPSWVRVYRLQVTLQIFLCYFQRSTFLPCEEIIKELCSCLFFEIMTVYSFLTASFIICTFSLQWPKQCWGSPGSILAVCMEDEQQCTGKVTPNWKPYGPIYTW